MRTEILENRMIERIAGQFLPAPHRMHKIHEADAELIDMGEKYDKYLAITTDALVEEIASGLYEDPYFIGWMLATVNFSDLAAVGADPLGLLVSINYPSTESDIFIEKLAEGISDACRELDTFVLGGDTNRGKDSLLSGCAVGLVSKNSTITRIGARPGDRCYLSAPAGTGSIYAFLRLSGKGSQLPESFYRPVARLKEGRIVRKYASCCMDTSDGVVHTLDTLMRLNQCRFILDDHWEKILNSTVLRICQAQNLPPWITLAGVHGEFELCFTVNTDSERDFLREASAIGWTPLCMGEVCEGEGVAIRAGQQLIPIDTGSIRNLSDRAGSDYEAYIHHLLDIARSVGI
jgi:thiamine-monophosphate kinase